MKSAIHNFLLSLAITTVATAADLPGDPTTTTAPVTVTATETACMIGGPEDATPIAIANALATATDVTAAASLIASLVAETNTGGGGTAYLDEPTAGTTTVTTFVNATDCPPKPTLDVSPTGELAKLLSDELDRIEASDTTTNATGIEPPNEHWSQGRNSLCFTNAALMTAGRYGVYLDGWGQEPDGCGKGALDNLRGKCGSIEKWECKYWGTGVVLTFWPIGARYAGCVVDAMWQASPHDKRETGLCCVYVGGDLTHGGRGSC